MNSANQAIEVVAGLAPPPPDLSTLLKHGVVDPDMAATSTTGGPMPEYTRAYFITSDEWNAALDQEEQLRILNHYETLANEYASQLRQSGLNWVQVTWVKF